LRHEFFLKHIFTPSFMQRQQIINDQITH